MTDSMRRRVLTLLITIGFASLSMRGYALAETRAEKNYARKIERCQASAPVTIVVFGDKLVVELRLIVKSSTSSAISSAR